MKTWFLAAALLLSACSTGPATCPRLPDGTTYCIAGGAWPDFETEQIATITYREKSMRMIARISSGEKGVHFAGVSLLGQTLLSVSLVDGVLRTEAPGGAAHQLDGGLLIALLQLSVWPADDLAKVLPPGLALDDRPGSRVIRNRNGDEVLSIVRKGETLPFERLRMQAPGAGLSIDSSALK